MQPNYPQNTPPQTPQVPPQDPQQPEYTQQPQQYFNEPQQPQSTQQYGNQPYEQPQYGTQPTDPYDNQQLQPNLYGAQPEPQSVSMVAAAETKSKKPMVILFIVIGAVLLIGLIAGGVYAWQSGLFGGQTEQVVEETPAPVSTEPTYDTPDAIETEITETQKAIDSIDDSQLADGTISDETLNQ